MEGSKGLDLVQLGTGSDYGSEFEYDSEVERKRVRREDLASKAKPSKHKVASAQEVTKEYDKEEGRKMRFHILSMDAYQRHRKFINDYLVYFGGSKADFRRDTSRDKTDLDVIRENHRFLWTDEDDPQSTWEKQLSKKYYDKLYKEYCITDLSRYKENKIAMRWRIEKEVVLGKGQFMCGNKHCDNQEHLKTWEVNFGYIEHGDKKNALVKLRLCPECSYKLNYRHKRREVTRAKKRKREDEQAERERPADTTVEHGVDSKTATDDQSQSSQSHNNALDLQSADQKGQSSSSADDNLWSGPVKLDVEKSREEEFEEYFDDMFL